MEEADTVSSSAPDGAPREIAMNEATAFAPTPADETLRNAEKTSTAQITSASQMTEVTSTAQMTEITSAPQITEETSAAQMIEEIIPNAVTSTAQITSASQMTEVTSAPQTTEESSAAQMIEETIPNAVTSTAQITEITSAPQITEETSTPTDVTSTAQMPEITSAPQPTEETSTPTDVTSAPQMTEITSAPQMTEITSAPQPTEETSTPTDVTSAPQMTEITSAPQMTEITSAPQPTEETSIPTDVTSAPQMTEITSAPQMTEITSAPQPTEETSIPTDVTSAPQMTEITSAPQMTEITSAPQPTEETSIPTDVTSAPQMTEITSAPQMTEITSAPQPTEETSIPTDVTSAPQMTEITSAPQMTEITSAPQPTEETSIPTDVTSAPQMTEITSAPQPTEETSTPTDVTSAPQMTEITSAPQMTEITSAPQPTEETSTPTDVTSAPQMTEITSAPQMTEITSAPQPTEETSTPTDVTSAPQMPEMSSTSPEEMFAGAASEERMTPESASSSSSSSSSSSEQPELRRAEGRDSASAPQQQQEEEEEEEEEEESSRQIASGDREPLTPHPAPPHEPQPSAAPNLLQFPSDRSHSPSIASQASSSLAMDSVGHKDSATFDPDVLSQSDDNFKFEMKKSPFQAFPPVSDGFGEATIARRSVEVSGSPSPDLVQDAYDEAHVQSEELEHETDADSPVSLSYAPPHLFSDVNTTSDDRPTSLPDILKSSPLNPDKLDSGSSEGSPDFSPVHRSMDDSPNSPFPANSPIGFDSKILLLKEMAEETEARAVERAKLEAEQSFTAFDLVKETDVPPKSDSLLKDKEDVEVFSQTAVQTADRFECLSFPSGTSREPSDSESPSADSFSPVLDAVTQEPSSFSVEQERRAIREDMDAAEEVSEQEVLSEEFEFVERPPRGASEEFLEMQDSLAFIKPSEMLQDEDRSPKLEPKEAADHMAATEDAENQSSYHLLTQASDKPSLARGKAGLESDLEEICPAPVIHPPVDKAGAEEEEAEVGSMCDLSAAAVLELLYWRDVRSSGLLFGSSLFLLLSLLSCSIISVLSYSTLALLSITISFRIYMGVLQAIQKSDEGHPFKQYLEKDVVLSKDVVQRHSDAVLSQINGVVMELCRLILVEDLIDSLTFAVFLWVLTYVGAWFNGLTLLILGLIGAFSGPAVYKKHQTQIDQFISMLKSWMKDVMGQIQAKVPGVKKSSE